MSSPERIAARITWRQSSGSRPPVGAIPISSPFARGRNPSASLRLATIGMSKRPESPSHSRTLRPAWVESITATIRSVPNRMTPMAVLPWWNPKLPSARITRRRSAEDGT